MAASQGNLDVAIIGGGIAGLYCLYRLLRDGNYKNKNLKLFEASDHLGGRIETWSLMREVPGKYDTGFTDTGTRGCRCGMDVTLRRGPMIRWTNWIVFKPNLGPCGLSRGINRFCVICSMSWTSQNKPQASQNPWTISFLFFLTLRKNLNRSNSIYKGKRRNRNRLLISCC